MKIPAYIIIIPVFYLLFFSTQKALAVSYTVSAQVDSEIRYTIQNGSILASTNSENRIIITPDKMSGISFRDIFHSTQIIVSDY